MCDMVTEQRLNVQMSISLFEFKIVAWYEDIKYIYIYL